VEPALAFYESIIVNHGIKSFTFLVFHALLGQYLSLRHPWGYSFHSQLQQQKTTTATMTAKFHRRYQEPKSTMEYNFLPLRGGILLHYVSWSNLLLVMYVSFYLSMDVLGAMLYFPCMYCLYAMAIHWTAHDHAQQAAVELKQFYLKHKTHNDAAKLLLLSSAAAIRLPPPHLPLPRWYGTGQFLQQAAMVHFLSWYIQIHWGHQLIEGAAPAVW
jgi:hypothetical protein